MTIAEMRERLRTVKEVRRFRGEKLTVADILAAIDPIRWPDGSKAFNATLAVLDSKLAGDSE